MWFRLFMAALLLCGICAAQVAVDQQVQMSRTGDAPAKSKPTPEQVERGRQMLETAEASANGMEGGMRAYALLQVANAYVLTNKKKALELLDNALMATKAVEDERTRNLLQEQILQAMVPLKPKKADELLDQIDSSARGQVLTSLLSYYERNNDWDRAIQVVYRIAAEQEVPYDAVGRIIQRLTANPPSNGPQAPYSATDRDPGPRIAGEPIVARSEDAGTGPMPKGSEIVPINRLADAQQLFVTALTSFKNHPPQQGRGTFSMGGGDFASLILANWKMMPRETVLDGIHAVLERTKQQAQNSSGSPQPMSVSMSSASGGVAFNSMYEFRLFQLLPVLKQLDSSEAEKLVKESQAVKGMLDKYPDGMNSIAPQGNGGGARGSGGPASANASMSMSMGSGSGGGRGGPGGMSPMLMQQVMKIVDDAAKHPDDALANAGTIPDKRMQVQAYMGIARTAAKTNASVAKQALEKALDSVSDLAPVQQVLTVTSLANMYLQLDDSPAAKKAIEKGMKMAENAYKQDTDADDPNKALKAYWPSSQAYTGLLRVAAKISPVWSMELLKDISDPELKGLGQIALAQSWLDLSPGGRTVMMNSKKGNMTMMSVDQ